MGVNQNHDNADATRRLRLQEYWLPLAQQLNQDLGWGYDVRGIEELILLSAAELAHTDSATTARAFALLAEGYAGSLMIAAAPAFIALLRQSDHPGQPDLQRRAPAAPRADTAMAQRRRRTWMARSASALSLRHTAPGTHAST